MTWAPVYMHYDNPDPATRIPMLIEKLTEVLIDIRGILYHFEEILLEVGMQQQDEEFDDAAG